MAKPSAATTITYLAVGFRSDPSIEFFAFQDEEAIVRRDDAAFESDRSSRVDVISRDHTNGNTRTAALGNGSGYFRPDGIFDTTDANARQLIDRVQFVVPVG